MDKIRNVKKTMGSRPTIEGAGVHLKRAFGNAQAPDLDPFLLLDDFHGTVPSQYIKGFPWHPHRGIETITYVLHGEVEHADSLGNRGLISSGDVQWMTAGSGIIHHEMPKGRADGLMWGFQLWANLPAAQKMMIPRYRDVTHEQIPTAQLEGGVEAKVICGRVGDVQGPVRDIVIDPQYLDVSIPPGGRFGLPVSRGYTAFAYTIQGRGDFDKERGRDIGVEHLVIFGDGDTVSISAGPEGLRFLLISGKPIKEPLAWYGPIVMNTQEELRIAFEEYQKGTFLKHGEP
jgi:hypothetical protein